MKLKFFSVCMLLVLMISVGFAKTYVRYNYAGYFPEARKRFVVMSDNDCSGKKWTVTDKNGKTILTGVVEKSVVGKGDHTPFEFNHEVDLTAVKQSGAFTFVCEGTDKINFTVEKNPYSSVTHSKLRWLRVNRAGSKDVLDREPAHFGDSACYVYRRKGSDNKDKWEEDKNGKKIDMNGGWYDGSECAKFTITQSLTTYALLRAYEINPDLFVKKYSKSDLVDVLDEAKWGLDYLMKTMPDDKEFIISVGGFADNGRGILLPHKDPLDGKRPAYSIFSPNQMGNTVAALALGASIFEKAGKKDSAKKYKAQAIKIFDVAVSDKASKPAWLEEEWGIYEDKKAEDNILLGAAELYKLTKDQKYLTAAKKYAKLAENSWWAAYGSAHMMAHYKLMNDVTDSKKYFLEDLNSFHENATKSGNIWSSPQDYSLFHIYSNMEVASSMLLYQQATSEKQYENVALNMLDYIYGCNNWGISFVSLPTVKNSVRNPFSQIYMLQQHLFPEGAVVVGPLDGKSHDEESQWCYFDQKAMATHKFNTSKVKFFDHSDDYMCARVNTFGVAQGVLLLSVATKMYGDGKVKEGKKKVVAKANIKKADDSKIHLRYNYLGYNPLRNKRVIVMAEKDLNKQKWVIKDAAGKKVHSGAFGVSLHGKTNDAPMAFNYKIDFTILKQEGVYTFETEGVKKIDLKIKKNPYGWILEKPLRWMRAARCGSEDCVDHKACHFGDSSMVVYNRKGIKNNAWVKHPEEKKISGLGGWHDAGDYLKFSLTIGYAAYFILRAYEVNPDIFEKKYSKTDLVDVLDEAKWGLEFLMRCMPDTNEFIIMAGGLDDHNVGLRLPHEDKLDGKRPVMSQISPTQMGYASAALAVGSGIFDKLGKKEDAKRYRDMAEKIFKQADVSKSVAPAWFDDTIGHYSFYGDDTKNDNMELAAAELYRLTKDQQYLDKAKGYSDKARAAGWRAWESVNMPAHMCLMEYYSVVKNDLRIDLDGFYKNSRKKGNIWGLPLKYVWGGLYSYIGVGAAAMEYELRTKSKKYRSLARNMLDYTLGVNNWGICFVATEDLPYTIEHPFSQVYTLQSEKFPTGAISEGPGDKRSWLENRNWFSFDPNAQPTHKFNTEKGVFYDHNKDYMCMETTIAGVADGIYMLALAAKLFND